MKIKIIVILLLQVVMLYSCSKTSENKVKDLFKGDTVTIFFDFPDIDKNGYEVMFFFADNNRRYSLEELFDYISKQYNSEEKIIFHIDYFWNRFESNLTDMEKLRAWLMDHKYKFDIYDKGEDSKVRNIGNDSNLKHIHIEFPTRSSPLFYSIIDEKMYTVEEIANVIIGYIRLDQEIKLLRNHLNYAPPVASAGIKKLKTLLNERNIKYSFANDIYEHIGEQGPKLGPNSIEIKKQIEKYYQDGTKNTTDNKPANEPPRDNPADSK
ncbi:MAG: hypothetical protein AB1599_09125 [Planctomycetota bacterium]